MLTNCDLSHVNERDGEVLYLRGNLNDCDANGSAAVSASPKRVEFCLLFVKPVPLTVYASSMKKAATSLAAAVFDVKQRRAKRFLTGLIYRTFGNYIKES